MVAESRGFRPTSSTTFGTAATTCQLVGDWASGEVTAVRFDPATGLIEGAASPRAGAAYVIGR